MSLPLLFASGSKKQAIFLDLHCCKVNGEDDALVGVGGEGSLANKRREIHMLIAGTAYTKHGQPSTRGSRLDRV